MTKLRSFSMALALLLVPLQAGAWIAENRNHVNPLPENGFEVVGQSGAYSSMAFWCSAGDYARRVLGAGPTQRIYVIRERGPAVTRDKKSAVHFSLVAPAGADTHPRFLLTVVRVGDNLNAASAQNYCYDRKDFN